MKADEPIRPAGTEKSFAFTSAERGYIARLTEVAANAQAQLGAVNAELVLVLGEARQRLGLPEDARLLPDLKRGGFVLIEHDEAAPDGEATTRKKVVDMPRPAPVGAN